jgi:hypothetical protein
LHESRHTKANACVVIASRLPSSIFLATCLRRWLGLALLLANTSGVCTAIAVSFFLNRKISFKVLDRVSARFFRFATVASGELAACSDVDSLQSWFRKLLPAVAFPGCRLALDAVG